MQFKLTPFLPSQEILVSSSLTEFVAVRLTHTATSTFWSQDIHRRIAHWVCLIVFGGILYLLVSTCIVNVILQLYICYFFTIKVAKPFATAKLGSVFVVAKWTLRYESDAIPYLWERSKCTKYLNAIINNSWRKFKRNEYEKNEYIW